MSLIQNRAFRNIVLRSLVGLYRSLATPDYVNMCQCLIFLEDPDYVAVILGKLVQSSEENQLMAYQIAFDLYESATQQFLERVLVALRETAPIPGLLETKPLVKLDDAASVDEEASDESAAEPKPKVELPTLDSLVSEDKYDKVVFLH